MVGYMSLEVQVDKDFSLARRKALLRRIGARLRRDFASDDGLLCFDDVRKIPRAVGRIYRGMRTVPVGLIGGSVGRCSEFDRDFMPTKASVGERWKRIDRAFHRGEELPPVTLYKVGGFLRACRIPTYGSPTVKRAVRCPRGPVPVLTRSPT